jgi:nucleotide-binding universal stress UspA family protein
MNDTMVVGVDGTPDSLAALGTAADLAEDAGASLVVVHVRHESAMSASSIDAGAGAAISDALDQVEKMSRERAAGVLTGRKVDWRFEICGGDPATELIAAARDQQARAIVVGGRSHRVGAGGPRRQSPPPRSGFQRRQGALRG